VIMNIAPAVWATTRPYAVPDEPLSQDLAHTAGMAAWRATEFLAGRALLRDLLRQLLPDAADAPIVASGNGKPELLGWPTIGINVSHDGMRVAACVAIDRAVGIDVQQPWTGSGLAMIRRCAHRHIEELAALAGRARAVELAWIWSAQEACVKAAGTGLSGQPWVIEVPPRSRSGCWREFSWRSLRERCEMPLSCAWQHTVS
jgi:4'-phosphopantetheinyl transferase